LHECLFSMLEKRKIDILIPELFKVRWKRKKLKNLEYLNDGIYFYRVFPKLKSKYLHAYKQNDYYFDSRKISSNAQALSKWTRHLRLILCKVKNLNKKIIVFNPVGSHPISIYENDFEGEYNLEKCDFKLQQNNLNESKLNIPLEQQAEGLIILEAFRKRYMCFYITLIESILKKIEDLQQNEDIKNKKPILENHFKKFAYQCIEFVKSDYINIEGNPLRWESFFNYFDIPIKVLNYDFKSIEFEGRTFKTFNQLKYCIFIEKNEKKIIEKLKKLGYREFSRENLDDKLAIGLDFRFYFPCSTITHIYFLSKYIWAFQLLILFYHSFEYIQKIKPKLRLTEREGKLFENFLPVMNSLFNISDAEVKEKAFFKYRTPNPDELEVIYNEFLMKNVKIIEKKLFKYFLIRCGK
ncbi:MAG: hypothetical protein ACFFAO_15995, partial [Candidatus Hermodarchaeota archaeon]